MATDKDGFHVVVIGGGIVGVSSAYFLSRIGAKVSVVERTSDLGLGTSFANAGRYCPLYARKLPIARPHAWNDAWNAVRLMIGSKGAEEEKGGWEGKPSSVAFTFENVSWGLHFLNSCRESVAERNHLAFQALATLSTTTMDWICDDLGWNRYKPDIPDEMDSHKLNVWLYDDDIAMSKAGMVLADVPGTKSRVLSCNECVGEFPSLHSIFDGKQGGCVVAEEDWIGDARKFTLELAKRCENVDFYLNENVQSLRMTTGKAKTVTSVSMESGLELQADAVVVCCGPQSGEFARTMLGLRLPIAAMRGCTIDLYGVKNGPEVSIADYASGPLNFQMTRFHGNRIRLSGYADFVPNITERPTEALPNGVRVPEGADGQLLDRAKTLFPNLEWESRSKTWCGLRPLTPDSLPIVSQVPGFSNVFLNTGHGPMGWSFCTSTAAMVSYAITESADIKPIFQPSPQQQETITQLLHQSQIHQHIDCFSASRFRLFP